MNNVIYRHRLPARLSPCTVVGQPHERTVDFIPGARWSHERVLNRKLEEASSCLTQP